MPACVLITGASRGIGRFLYEEFSARGFPVYGSRHNSAEDRPELDVVDVTSFEAVERWINSRAGDQEAITLINCAGTTYNAMAHNSDPSKWAEVINVNLVGTYHTIRAVLPIMRAKGFGRIINFSSVVGQKGALGASAYAASKAALHGLTKSVSIENAAKGITINNINLGYFNIGMIEMVPEKLLAKVIEQTPTGRLGDKASILSAVDFLMNTPDATGASIDVNGGLF